MGISKGLILNMLQKEQKPKSRIFTILENKEKFPKTETSEATKFG